MTRPEPVRLAGFGTIADRNHPARIGALRAAPASCAVRFRPGEALRDAVDPARAGVEGAARPAGLRVRRGAAQARVIFHSTLPTTWTSSAGRS